MALIQGEPIEQLASDKLADRVAVTSDPLADIAAMREVDFVMRSGRIAKLGGELKFEVSLAPPGAR